MILQANDIEPRLMVKAAVLKYCGGISVMTLQRHIKAGLLPRRLQGTQLWDKKAIDAHLDRASGLGPSEPARQDNQPSPPDPAWNDVAA